MYSVRLAKATDIAPCAFKKANGAYIFIAAMFLLAPFLSANDRIDFPDGGALIYIPASAIPSPAPTPTPTPSPTPEPATNKPDKLENMAETSPGVYETTSGWQSGAAVLQYHLQNVKYGSIVEVEFDRAISIPEGYKGNTKTYRAWAGKIGGTGTYNFYIGTPDGSWKFVWVEYITNAIRYTLDLPPTDGNYHREKYRFTYPSGVGKTDGVFEYWIDGSLVRTGKPWKLDGPNSSLENIHCIQLDTPSWSPSTNSYMRVKNVSVKVL